MQYDFLKHFPKRMKNIGLYAKLILNTTGKTTWNQYGFGSSEEQLNFVLSVMLFIMEQSLREENCTLDDIGVFIDNLNSAYFRKALSYEQCRNLGDFVVNTILSNEGKMMSFSGYDYEVGQYRELGINFVKNRVIYEEGDRKRTSYSLTDDGYNLMLSTLEVENNLKLTIQEMIFQLHLEKQSYDKAVDDIKNVFTQMRIQLQKMREAMYRIRRNALEYSVSEYEEILNDNLSTIGDTKKKFEGYRHHVEQCEEELEQKNINVEKLSDKDEENLRNLRIIGTYLNQTIDEHQKILNLHFDLKELYTNELEQLSDVSAIKRFSIRTELYEKILKNPNALEDMEYFFAPLFNQEVSKIYNLKLAYQYQKTIRETKEPDSVEKLDFDEKEWEIQQERLRNEKKELYKKSICFLVCRLVAKKQLKLSELAEEIGEDEEGKRTLIPNVDIFKEIMVELIKSGRLDIPALKEERKHVISDGNEIFVPTLLILDELEQYDPEGNIVEILIEKTGNKEVIFHNLMRSDNSICDVKCSEICFYARRAQDGDIT